jgi:hypothetical protein
LLECLQKRSYLAEPLTDRPRWWMLIAPCPQRGADRTSIMGAYVLAPLLPILAPAT